MIIREPFGMVPSKMGSQTASLVPVVGASQQPLYIALAGLGVVAIAATAIIMTRKSRSQEAVANADPDWTFWKPQQDRGAQWRKAFYKARARASEASRRGRHADSWWYKPYYSTGRRKPRRTWGRGGGGKMCRPPCRCVCPPGGRSGRRMYGTRQRARANW
ncbi:MAG: hypothetical protein V2A79_18205 [Planctomycetota bacterium]